jgi:hypothetical protein
VALQKTHRENGVRPHGDGGDQDQEVPQDARALDAHKTLAEDLAHAQDGEAHTQNTPARGPLQTEREA